jgi:potassium-transporting ATPase potassium-binding subunit
MTTNDFIQWALYFVVLLLLAKPLGAYMADVYEGRIPKLARLLSPLEKAIYWVGRVDPDEEMSWKRYTGSFLIFNVLGFLAVYALQRFQASLPLNPAGMAAVSADSSFNTAVSFTSNTNWQGYGGESTMSYLTQMVALTVQNFVSAAVGMAVVVALIRGFARQQAKTLGNFYADTVRGVIYILLPLSVVLAVVLVSQGVVQTFSAYKTASLLQSLKDSNGKDVVEQLLAVGPAASQIAIKQLGTNGGGFFNANSSHPFENPTPLSNFLQMLSILLIPGALCYTFGKMVKDTRQGWAILATMTIILVALMGIAIVSEQGGNPAFNALHIDQTASALQSGGNMEGKEVRYGIANSAIWAAATTAASNGSVNAMHDSFTPMGGFVPLWLIQLGEIIFGGVGSGLYGMLIFALVAVFISGLMVGRTPEYLGKKIEAFEMKMASIAILIPAVAIKVGAAISVTAEAGQKGIFNPGAHGFSEVLYGFSSAVGNNGSAFAGLGANTPFYNTALGVAMLIGRYWIIVPVMAVAGMLAQKKRVPASSGTLPTHTPLFVMMLLSVIVIVGSLTFLPSLALGPVVEQLQFMK